ncbi:MAG TPA: Yip1 family protein [Anaerolineales bacterium]|nr:Yip1 family protein [Anaerolineales bacterium]
MNEQMNAPTPALPPPSGVSEWFSVWRDAVTKPNEQTFARIASSPNAKLTTALLWVFLGALVSSFLTALVPNPFLNQMMQNYNFDTTRLGGGVGEFVIRVICGAPIAAAIGVVVFVIGAGIVHLLAKMFGGRGTFDQLAYTLAAIQTPFALVTGVLGLLSAIPVVGLCFGLVSLALLFYVAVLAVMAVKAVNQFGWGQAAASLLLPVLVFCCCISVGAFAIARMISTNMPGGFPFPTLVP